MQYYEDYLSLTDSTAMLPTILRISLLVLLRLMVYSAIPGISAAWQLVLLTVHISGYICRTHHTRMCCIYQTQSAASNLQFGPTKGRILSAAVDTATRAISDSWAPQRLGQHSGCHLPYSPTLLVGARHHTRMHWEQSCPGGGCVGWCSHEKL